MKIRSALSVLMAAVIAATTILPTPVAMAYSDTAVTEDSERTVAHTTAEGTNSFGDMFSADLTESISSGENRAYSVNNVTIDGNYLATVNTTLQSRCKIIVAVYDDSGKNMLTYSETFAEQGINDVTVQLDGSKIPEFYVVRAYAVSPATEKAVSVEYMDESHTEKWYNFNQKTIDDFPAELVYNLDADTDNNFVVYNSSVKRVDQDGNANIPIFVDYQENKFSFKNADESLTSLQNGDLLSFLADDNIWIMIEVTSVSTVDGVTTISGNDKQMEDFFSFIKINLDQQDFLDSAEDAAQRLQTPQLAANAEPAPSPAAESDNDQLVDEKFHLYTVVELKEENSGDETKYTNTVGGYLKAGSLYIPYMGSKNNNGKVSFVTNIQDGSNGKVEFGTSEPSFGISYDDNFKLSSSAGNIIKMECKNEDGSKTVLDYKNMIDTIEGKEAPDEKLTFSFGAKSDIVLSQANVKYSYSESDNIETVEYTYDLDVNIDINAKIKFEKEHEIPLGTIPIGVSWLTLSIDCGIEVNGEINCQYEYESNSSFRSYFDGNSGLPAMTFESFDWNHNVELTGSVSIKITASAKLSLLNDLLSLKVSAAVELEIKTEKGGTKNDDKPNDHRCIDCTLGSAHLRLYSGYELVVLFGLLKPSHEFTLCDVTLGHFHTCFDCDQPTHDQIGTPVFHQCPCLGSVHVDIVPYYVDENGNKVHFAGSETGNLIPVGLVYRPEYVPEDMIMNIYQKNTDGTIDRGSKFTLTPDIDFTDPNKLIWRFSFDPVINTDYYVEIIDEAFTLKEETNIIVSSNMKELLLNNKTEYKVGDGKCFSVPLEMTNANVHSGKIVSTDGMPITEGTATITYIPLCNNKEEFMDKIDDKTVVTYIMTAEVDENGCFTFVYPMMDRDTGVCRIQYQGKHSYGEYVAAETIFTEADKNAEGRYVLYAERQGYSYIEFVDAYNNPVTGDMTQVKLTLEPKSYDIGKYTHIYTPDDEGRIKIELPYIDYWIDAEFLPLGDIGYYIDSSIDEEERGAGDDLQFSAADDRFYVRLFDNTDSGSTVIGASTAKFDVEVIVLDHEGNPVEGAEIESNLICIGTATTDSDGRAKIRLPNGSSFLTATKSDHVGMQAVEVNRNNCQGENAVVITLSEEKIENRLNRIGVQVIDLSGNSLSNIPVTIDSLDYTVTTNENGIADFELLDGTYIFTAKKGESVASRSYKVSFSTSLYPIDFDMVIDTAVSIDDDFVKVFSNGTTMAGITSDGSLYMWGANGTYGLLGCGTDSTEINTPVYVNLDGEKAADVKLGAYNVAVITEDGDLYMWGANQDGQLATGDKIARYTPAKVDLNSEKAKDVYFNCINKSYSTMVLTESGKLYFAGHDVNGSTIGMNNSGTVLSFVEVNIPEPVRYYSCADASSGFYTKAANIAVSENGTLYTWGDDSDAPAALSFNGEAVDKVSYNNSTYMVITTNDNLYMWGNNSTGQVGNGTTTRTESPALIMQNVSKAKCYNGTTAATTNDGKLYVWGDTKYCQALNDLEVTESPCEVVIAGESFASSDADIHTGTCIIILADSGNVYGWGNIWDANIDYLEPELLFSGADAIGGTTVNGEGVLYCIKNGTIYTMGDNTYGQCGIGSAEAVKTAQQVALNGNAIYVGHINGKSMYALTDSGSIYVWGMNPPMGNDLTGNIISPVRIALANSKYIDVTVTDVNGVPLSNATVSAGPQKLVTNSSGTTRFSLPPSDVTFTAEYMGISITKDVTVPNNNVTDALPLTLAFSFDYDSVSQIPDLKFISADGGYTAHYVVAENGALYMLNHDGTYQLIETEEPIAYAYGTYTEKVFIAISENGTCYYRFRGGSVCKADIPERVIDVAVYNENFAAITESGKLYMWGSNDSDIVTAESISVRNDPQLRTDISEPIRDIIISAGASYYELAAAVTQDGKLYTWGGTSGGCLGRTVAENEASSTPGLVNISNVEKIMVISSTAAALTANGELYLWGKGNVIKQSSVGDESDVPVKVTLDEKVTDFCLGRNIIFVITESGKLYTWGYNSNKPQFGIDATDPVNTITQVQIPETVTKVTNANDVTIALTGSGAVYVWGENSKGQLGTGTNVDSSVPVLIGFDGNAASDISTRDGLSTVLLTNGALYMFGMSKYYYPTKLSIPDPSAVIQTANISQDMQSDPVSTSNIIKRYTDLEPDALYNFYAKDTDGKLIYIAQYKADENGIITADFVSSVAEPKCSISKLVTLNVAYAEVTAPDVTTNTIAVADINVILNGETLRRGIDYYLSGDIFSEEPDTYNCAIYGAGEFYGYQQLQWTLTSENSVDSIAVSKLPTKTSYKTNEKLDLTGGEITVTYTSGKTEKLPITADMISGFNSAVAGTKTITVTYQGKTAVFEVTIRASSTGGFSGGSSGGSSGGGFSGGSSGGGSSAQKDPELNGKSMTWSEMAAEIAKLDDNSEITIRLNGNTSVPKNVIEAIADKDIKAICVVNDNRSWTIDGAEIEDPSSADLSIVTVTSLDTSDLRGTYGTKFRINDTNAATTLNLSFNERNCGKFANLYRKEEGKLVFVDTVKVDENGNASCKLSDDGDYAVMLCEYSDRIGDVNNDGATNTFDVAAILRDSVKLEAIANPAMYDFNGDGAANIFDASAILRMLVGMKY